MPDPVKKLEDMLDYRLPTSDRPMQSIVLPREDAHKLLMYIRKLEFELETKRNKFTSEPK
jgi:hypothetical protein